MYPFPGIADANTAGTADWVAESDRLSVVSYAPQDVHAWAVRIVAGPGFADTTVIETAAGVIREREQLLQRLAQR